MLQGAASVGAISALGGLVPKQVAAGGYSDLRAEILKIPGVGAASPTDSDWQKVGELCLGPTKERVAEGEFEGVELTFLGLNNQNLHNSLGRLRAQETRQPPVAQKHYGPVSFQRHKHHEGGMLGVCLGRIEPSTLAGCEGPSSHHQTGATLSSCSCLHTL